LCGQTDTQTHGQTPLKQYPPVSNTNEQWTRQVWWMQHRNGIILSDMEHVTNYFTQEFRAKRHDVVCRDQCSLQVTAASVCRHWRSTRYQHRKELSHWKGLTSVKLLSHTKYLWRSTAIDTAVVSWFLPPPRTLCFTQRLSVCLSACLPACLPVCLSACLLATSRKNILIGSSLNFTRDISVNKEAWALAPAGMDKGGTCPPSPSGNVEKCFLLQMLSETSVVEVFMHHFEKISSASGTPPGRCP